MTDYQKDQRANLSDQERLERLLVRWENEPGVMLFGPGTNTCGKVAGWIKADRESLRTQLASARKALEEARQTIETSIDLHGPDVAGTMLATLNCIDAALQEPPK